MLTDGPHCEVPLLGFLIKIEGVPLSILESREHTENIANEVTMCSFLDYIHLIRSLKFSMHPILKIPSRMEPPVPLEVNINHHPLSAPQYTRSHKLNRGVILLYGTIRDL
jgi:hypothetical protein